MSAKARKSVESKTICEDCGGETFIGAWPFCHGDASKHVSARPARHEFEAITIYRDKYGRVRVPGKGNWKPPKGWQKEEIRTRKEADQITKEMGTRDRKEWEALREREAAFFENSLGRNRAEIEKLRRDVDDPKVREFIDIAIKRSDESDRQSMRYEPGVYFHVLE